MGLLSDPEYGSVKWVRVLKKVHGPLSFLCYFCAIAWFLALGYRDFNNETYFSENALLPGLVTNEFNAEQSAKQIHNELLQELNDKYEDVSKIPVPWLVAKMSQLHLEVYMHNFTLNYPLGQGQIFQGTNVYGILRAARSSSLEAIVISVPYRPLSSHQKGTTAGIALMLAFAQFARPQKYWAKDIIFLVTEHEQLGMQAWLEAYHGLQGETDTFRKSLGSFWEPGTSGFDFSDIVDGFNLNKNHKKCLDPGELKGRSGSIQAAINLEFHTAKIKYIEVKVEGLNGQLPNLDLVNLMHKLCDKYGVHHSYKHSFSWMHTRNKMDKWKTSVWTMLSMVTTQLPGVPNGNHGLFHRFGIEAVTLEGREVNDPAGDPPRVNALASTSFYRLGVVLESAMRSLNNLLERFHQSYFFYVLAGTDRFISIGQYMPSLCLLCVAMLVKASSMWVSIQQNETVQESTKKDEKSKENEEKDEKKEKESPKKDKKSKENEELLEKDEKKEKRGDKKVETVEKEINLSVVNIGANYLIVHLLGYAVMNSPTILSRIGAAYNIPTQLSVYYGLVTISILLIITTPILHKCLRKGPVTYEEMALVNILALIELSTACLAIGMHNFSLGLVVAIFYTPLALVAGTVRDGKGSTIISLMKRILCIILQPISILTIALTVYSGILYSEEQISSILHRGWEAAVQSVMFAVVDSMIYGNWLFNVATTTMLPIWIIFWQNLNTKVSSA